MTENDFWSMVQDGRIIFGSQGDNVPAVKLFLCDVQSGLVPRTWWPHTEVGHSQEAKREVQALFPDTVPFDTPKPERLLQRVIEISSEPGDLVLDSFAGSGTTGAVSHKMRRRWIMVEVHDHCHTLIVPRLRKCIDGTDNGGVTASTDWKGGGGFRYYNLAPSLLERDRWGQWVINSKYNSAMLTEALCKIEGFTYAPSDTVYWQQGQSTERDFIYVTTQNLSPDQLQELSDDVGTDRTLLVLCPAFRGDADRWDNLTVRKIPRQILSRCEWGHDDYSLKVQNLPQPPGPPGQQTLFDLSTLEGSRKP